MKELTKTILTAVFLLAALPANAEFLDCAVRTGASQNGFISDRYIFDYDVKAGKVMVLDGVIQYVNEVPLAGKVSAANDKKLGVSWSLKLKSTTGIYIRMLYRASIVRAGMSVQISAVPQGGDFAGGFEARGTCKVVKK